MIIKQPKKQMKNKQSPVKLNTGAPSTAFQQWDLRPTLNIITHSTRATFVEIILGTSKKW